MFRRGEFSKVHLIAVRLVDAINCEASKVIPGFNPIILGFKLKVGKLCRPDDKRQYTTLKIRPAGWPTETGISCWLLTADCAEELWDGLVRMPDSSTFKFHGIHHDYPLQPWSKPIPCNHQGGRNLDIHFLGT